MVFDFKAFLWVVAGLGLFAIGIALFWSECRQDDLPWSTILPFTAVSALVLIFALVVASQ